MIIRIFSLFLVSVALVCGADETTGDAKMPDFVGQQLLTIAGRLRGPLSGMRVEILRIPEGVDIDPAPGLATFERDARVTVILRADHYAHDIEDVINSAKNSSWTEKEFPGYPRWCVRFVGTSDEAFVEWLIDREASAISANGKWFRVSGAFIDALTVNLVKEAVDDVAR